MASSACKSCDAPSSFSSSASGLSTHKETLEEIPKTDAPFDKVSPPDVEPEQSLRASENPTDDSDLNHTLTFHGQGGTLLGIQAVNIFLTLVTFGIYLFWGKVNVRKYLIGQTAFKGDRFAYHGTGMELFIGSMKAFLVLGAMTALFQAAPLMPGGKAVSILAFTSGYLGFMLFIPIAVVGSLRYRLSRTSWRGIRLSFRGPVKDYVKISILGGLFSFLTLGLYYPIFHARKRSFLVSNAYFGSLSFDFDGEGKDLFNSFLLALLLTIPTLGFCWFWYMAERHRYYWSHTKLGSSKFKSTVTGSRLLILSLTNILLLIVTLGFAWSWTSIRKVQFNCSNLLLEGRLDMESIFQDAQSATATGEGLGNLLELETDFGIG
ncbi:MAG: YjgN family protein [Nitrospiria bacterium]